jgi:toxin HigB-1
VIKSFGDKKSEKLFNDEFVKDFQGFAARAKRKLEAINAAVRLEDLAVPPLNRLEKLQERDDDRCDHLKIAPVV